MISKSFREARYAAVNNRIINRLDYFGHNNFPIKTTYIFDIHKKRPEHQFQLQQPVRKAKEIDRKNHNTDIFIP